MTDSLTNPTSLTETVIDTRPIPLTARDYGGAGQPLLLLHGAGANLAHLAWLAEHLQPTHRVVAVDLRGHGGSGDGEWEWDEVLADLAAVAEHLGLHRPAMVGHSLGGILAALWAERHPECPGAVSIDGNPPLHHTSQLSGLEPRLAEARLAVLTATFDGMAAMLAEPLDADQIEGARLGQRVLAQRYGVPPDAWEAAFVRNLAPTGDGRFQLRPGPELTAQLRAAMSTVDLFTAYRNAQCPLLLMLATEDIPEQQPFQDLYAAYRRAVDEQLATVDNIHVQVRHLPAATHALAADRPAEVAAHITEFLAR